MNRRRKYFTLIELLVAMGLLALLVMLMLQLFGGAQRLWVASEKRSNVYADARVAMELMAELINAVQFSHGEKLKQVTDTATNRKLTEVARDETLDTVFYLKNDTAGSSVLIFAASTDRGLKHKSSKNYFISFQRKNDDLYMTYMSDTGAPDATNSSESTAEDCFYSLFPPYGLSKGYPGIDTRENALNKLKTVLTPADDENEYSQLIAKNVIKFDVQAYKIDASTKKLVSVGTGTDVSKEPPYMLTIRMTMLDDDSYKKWSAMPDENADAKKNFLIQHQRTFSRNVFIGNRWVLESESEPEP